MVKIKTQNMVFDNGALDMAMNLAHIDRGNWTNCPKEAIFLDLETLNMKTMIGANLLLALNLMKNL